MNKEQERDAKIWQDQKSRPKTERKQLTLAERIKFVELVSQLATPGTFERHLGLAANDIEHYKKQFNIESQDEARCLLRKLRKADADKNEARAIEQISRVREAEIIANERLKELEARKQASVEPKPKPDINVVRKEDAERQRRFEASEKDKKVDVAYRKALKDGGLVWQLPIDSHDSVERFRREIMNRGFSFCFKKYGATANQIKTEAERLKLKINWDIVRR
jgi:autonomous glycyl radical cofactor GrcA